MITENGSIKVSTQMDDKVQKEFSKNNFLMGLILTIISSIGLAVFLVLDIVSIFLEFEDDGLFAFVIVFAVFLGLGISLLILVNKAANSAKTSNKIYTYEFFKDYFTATETLNGENVATAKFYNSQVIKSRETKNYLFFYTNAATACPVFKGELTEEELNTLRSIFRLPVKGGTVELNAEAVQPKTENTQEVAPKSDDPFDEFKN